MPLKVSVANKHLNLLVNRLLHQILEALSYHKTYIKEDIKYGFSSFISGIIQPNDDFTVMNEGHIINIDF